MVRALSTAVHQKSSSSTLCYARYASANRPIFLLTVVDGETLPRDWFGSTKKCAQFLEGLNINDVCRLSNKYADGIGRKNACWKSCLLLRLWNRDSLRLLNLHHKLKYGFGPEPKRKCKRFCKRASAKYNFDIFYIPHPEVVIRVTPVDLVGVKGNPQRLVDANPDGNTNVVNEAGVPRPPRSTTCCGDYGRSATATASRAARAAKVRLHDELYRGRYLTQDFLEDIANILRNLEARAHEDFDRRIKRRSASPEKSKREANREEDAAQLQQQQNGNGNGMMTMRRAYAEEENPSVPTSKQAPGVLDGQQDVDEVEIIGPSPVSSPGPQLQLLQQHHLQHHISTSDLRTPRANQALFLMLRLRQRQGHLVASSLSGGERLLLLPINSAEANWPITPFLPKANMSAPASKSLSKSTIVDFHTKERSQEWISNERLHHDYNLSTASLASPKKFAMHREGKLETKAILAFQSIRLFPHRTIVATEMRRAEKPEAELILTSQPQRKPPTVAVETPILSQRSSNFVKMSSLFDLTMANLQKFATLAALPHALKNMFWWVLPPITMSL
ncbi:hypothetical protein JOM56_000608 [Amanita muscaria]